MPKIELIIFSTRRQNIFQEQLPDLFLWQMIYQLVATIELQVIVMQITVETRLPASCHINLDSELKVFEYFRRMLLIINH